MPQYRSHTSTHGRNMAGARALWRATGVKEGDFVTVGLPATGLSLAAMLGYLFPAFTTVLGALLGMHSGGGDASIALGAAAGFVGSLVIAGEDRRPVGVFTRSDLLDRVGGGRLRHGGGVRRSRRAGAARHR